MRVTFEFTPKFQFTFFSLHIAQIVKNVQLFCKLKNSVYIGSLHIVYNENAYILTS